MIIKRIVHPSPSLTQTRWASGSSIYPSGIKRCLESRHVPTNLLEKSFPYDQHMLFQTIATDCVSTTLSLIAQESFVGVRNPKTATWSMFFPRIESSIKLFRMHDNTRRKESNYERVATSQGESSFICRIVTFHDPNRWPFEGPVPFRRSCQHPHRRTAIGRGWVWALVPFTLHENTALVPAGT